MNILQERAESSVWKHVGWLLKLESFTRYRAERTAGITTERSRQLCKLWFQFWPLHDWQTRRHFSGSYLLWDSIRHPEHRRQRDFPSKGHVKPAMTFKTMPGESFCAFACAVTAWNLPTSGCRMVHLNSLWCLRGTRSLSTTLFAPEMSFQSAWFVFYDSFSCSVQAGERNRYKRSESVGRGLFDLGETDCIMEEIKRISEINGGKYRTETIPVIWPTASTQGRVLWASFPRSSLEYSVSSACYTSFFLVNLRYSVTQKCCLERKVLSYLTLHWDWKEKYSLFRERN